MDQNALLIVPGLSTPFLEKHWPSYDMLVRAAPQYGFTQANVLCLPGQQDRDGVQRGELSFKAAVHTVCEAAVVAQGRVRLLGISFGCAVGLEAARQLGADRVSVVTCWGCIPLWTSWRAFSCGVDRAKFGIGTRTIPDVDFYAQLMPVEYLLSECPCPARVCTGGDDEYSPPQYFDYLRATIPETRPVEFRLVPGFKHNVKPKDVSDPAPYLRAVLG